MLLSKCTEIPPILVTEDLSKTSTTYWNGREVLNMETFPTIRDNIYYSDTYYSVEIVTQKIAIDNQLSYTEYLIYEYDMDGTWQAIVEDEVPELLEYQSYFILQEDTLYIADCYQDNRATYNLLIGEIDSSKQQYQISYIHDCEACSSPEEYTIIINYANTPRIYYLNSKLINYFEEE